MSQTKVLCQGPKKLIGRILVIHFGVWEPING